MRFLCLVGGLLLVAGCESVAPPGADCGANSMQTLVGRPAVDVAKFIGTQPRYVQENAYWLGESEEIGPEIPPNALIARVSVDHVGKLEDLIGAEILSMTCNR